MGLGEGLSTGAGQAEPGARSLLPKTRHCQTCAVTHTHPKQQEPRLGRVITATDTAEEAVLRGSGAQLPGGAKAARRRLTKEEFGTPELEGAGLARGGAEGTQNVGQADLGLASRPEISSASFSQVGAMTDQNFTNSPRLGWGFSPAWRSSP